MSSVFPYVLVGNVAGPDSTAAAVLDQVERSLAEGGFQKIGRYSPAHGGCEVLVVTTESLRRSIVEAGVDGLSAVAAGILRVGATALPDGAGVLVSRTCARYWGPAMFGKKPPASVDEASMTRLDEEFAAAVAKAANFVPPPGDKAVRDFGHQKGFKYADMHSFQYMFGMPRLADVADVGAFASHDEAVAAVTKALEADGSVCKKVYSQTFEDDKGRKSTSFGVALGGPTGESHFMPIIDIADVRHVCALPYELVVLSGGKVVMPHGRFRIALAFPALTMMTFTKIMSTPGDIADAGKRICAGGK